MITFENPAFLLLLIPLVIGQILWHFPSRSGNILQFFINLFLVCALSGMNIRLPEKEGTLFILCDRSLSMPAGAEKVMEQHISNISKKMKNAPGIISFAGTSLVESSPGSGSFKGFRGVLSDRNASRTGNAINEALRLIPQGTPGRILLISDGLWNGNSPESALSRAVMRRIQVDLLPLKTESGRDFAITGVTAPLRVAPGEYCSVVCQVYAPFPARIKCRIRKDQGAWQSREVSLQRGMNRIFWRDRSSRSGVSRFDFAIEPPQGDETVENNTASHLVETGNPGKILLLSRTPSGNLGKLLRASGFDVETVSPPSPKVTPENLGSYRAVILENLPASALEPRTIALMAELVRSGRMGLLMTGGSSSFAVGGWYKTPVGDILPAALEQQHDIRRRKAAVMIALDRSGSMAANIDGVTKMAMANLAASESYKLLSPLDEFGLIAVDSSVHQVVPLANKGDSPDPTGNILSIESMGGGIFIDKALHEALRQLSESKAPVRHLLLFADAADAEQPGNYRELLQRAVKAGITVSVVGLGSEASCDAGLLKEIARLGRGKCYFADNASELPRIFAEDTFVMARASFVREKSFFTPTADLSLLPGAEKITGELESAAYNLCFPKEQSRVLLNVKGTSPTPAALTGYAGLGRTAALAIEADGEFSGAFASDARAGTLLAALIRYVMMPRETTRKDCFITQSMDAGIFKSGILLDPERRKLPFAQTPRLKVLISHTNGKVELRTLPFTWQGADHLSAELPVPSGATVNGAVEFSDGEMAALAPAVNTLSPEFAGAGSQDIADLIRRMGGTVRSNFDNLGSLMEVQKSYRSCRVWLLGGAIVLLLLQIWMRRCGKEFPIPPLTVPSFTLPRWKKTVSPARKKKVGSPQKEAPASSDMKSGEPEQSALSEALKRAKRK